MNLSLSDGIIVGVLDKKITVFPALKIIICVKLIGKSSPLQVRVFLLILFSRDRDYSRDTDLVDISHSDQILPRLGLALLPMKFNVKEHVVLNDGVDTLIDLGEIRKHLQDINGAIVLRV